MVKTPSSNNQTRGTSYQNAGVNIDEGKQLIKNIKPFVEETMRPGVISRLGHFAALFDIAPLNYKNPVLVSSTDGVGTKLIIAEALNNFDTIGIDLVAMCVNDLLAMGAQPLFFLDYYATGRLNLDIATNVIKGIARGCKLANIALVGGETAEMPGYYQNNDFDLAGFSVGIIEKEQIITGESCRPGDVLIGIASSGFHSNGYSLIRKILRQSDVSLTTKFGSSTIGDTLLSPTKIYTSNLLPLFNKGLIKGCAHITGGGLEENIPRILPEGVGAAINLQSWELPEIFSFFQEKGEIRTSEMYRTFNCGVGMAIVVENNNVDSVINQLHSQGESSWVLGKLINCGKHNKIAFN